MNRAAGPLTARPIAGPTRTSADPAVRIAETRRKDAPPNRGTVGFRPQGSTVIAGSMSPAGRVPVTESTATRPDGREPSAETLMLRSATRALRLHLDQLPVDYDLATSADRFLASAMTAPSL